MSDTNNETTEREIDQCIARAMRALRNANRYPPGCFRGDIARGVIAKLFAAGSVLSQWGITVDDAKCFIEDEDMFLGRSYRDENGESQPGTCGITWKCWRPDLLTSLESV
tara:strand:+ start:2338 stop:2667 length:330 start_codon:yes stop_codon:yes gene_type:complete